MLIIAYWCWLLPLPMLHYFHDDTLSTLLICCRFRLRFQLLPPSLPRRRCRLSLMRHDGAMPVYVVYADNIALYYATPPAGYVVYCFRRWCRADAWWRADVTPPRMLDASAMLIWLMVAACITLTLSPIIATSLAPLIVEGACRFAFRCRCCRARLMPMPLYSRHYD